MKRATKGQYEANERWCEEKYQERLQREWEQEKQEYRRTYTAEQTEQTYEETKQRWERGEATNEEMGEAARNRRYYQEN